MVADCRRGDDEVQEAECMKGVRHLYETGITRIPKKYILPIPDRPDFMNKGLPDANRKLRLPVIDLAGLHLPDHRSPIIKSIRGACVEYGFFHVVNHGIPMESMKRMVDIGRRFFGLPFEERSKYMSSDIRSPVRYGTSFNQVNDGVFCWRDFLKLNCHPLDTLSPLWPSSPADLREEIAMYVKQSKSLFMTIMGAILDTLGLDDEILKEFEEGSHLMVVNCFPPCPQPDLTLGMPPHSDFGFLTLLLPEDVEGLQVQCKGEWITVDPLADSIVVNVGDHLEMFSNGRYKSVLHRVLVNSTRSRISVASLHSLPASATVRPAAALLTVGAPRMYKDTDFAAFLDYIASCDSKHKNFLETRKLTSSSPGEIEGFDIAVNKI